jgi:hypothetical protein
VAVLPPEPRHVGNGVSPRDQWMGVFVKQYGNGFRILSIELFLAVPTILNENPEDEIL